MGRYLRLVGGPTAGATDGAKEQGPGGADYPSGNGTKAIGNDPTAEAFPGPDQQQNSVDPYAWALRNALRTICRPDCPAGMLAWLQGSYPWLYTELTERIPREIHELATSRAPLEKFDQLLCRWLDYHEEGCQLYAVWQRSIRPHWRESVEGGNGSSSKPNSQAQLDS